MREHKHKHKLTKPQAALLWMACGAGDSGSFVPRAGYVGVADRLWKRGLLRMVSVGVYSIKYAITRAGREALKEHDNADTR